MLQNSSKDYQTKLTLWMNHLLVIYAALLPLSVHGRAQVLFAILVLFVIRGNFKLYLKDLFVNPIILSFIFMFLLYVFWIYGSNNLDQAKHLLDQNKYALLLPLFLSFIDKRFAIRVVGGFVIGILISEIFSYLISFDAISPSLHIFDVRIFHNQASIIDPSPFMLHTKYGLALGLVVTLLIHNLLTQPLNVLEKIITLFFIVSVTINISITGGRIGYLLYMILIPTVIIITYPKKVFSKLILAFIMIFIVASLAYDNSSLFKNRINLTYNTITTLVNNPTDFTSSFGRRLGMWNYGLDVISKNFLLGVGTGDHVDAIKEEVSTQKSTFRVISHPHNQFISVSLQFGIIGLLIFLSIFYFIFTYRYPSHYQRNIAILITIAILLTFMIEGDKIKFFLPLWITFMSISMAKKEYIDISFESLNIKLLSQYILIFIVALLLAFII